MVPVVSFDAAEMARDDVAPDLVRASRSALAGQTANRAPGATGFVSRCGDLRSRLEAGGSGLFVQGGPAVVEYSILGPLVVRDGSVRIDRAPERRLLAALLIHANDIVPHEALLESFGNDDQRANTRRALRDAVAYLDARLGTGRIAAHPSGYAISVDDDELDARTFERLLEEGMRDASNPERSLSTLSAALGLWKGDALEEFAAEPFAQAEAERLENLRLRAVEEVFELRLDRGEHRAILHSISDAVAAHPLRERLTGQLMLAMYRSGREQDARNAYEQLRRHLTQTLGIEPSTRLRRLERSIRTHDSRLERRAEPRPRGARDGGAPSQGATQRARFGPAALVGRNRELSVLEDELERASSGRARALVLRGDVGLGKTRLVMELMERNVGRVRTLRTSCPEQLSVPFFPIVQLIEQLSASSNRVSTRRARDLVRRLTQIAGDGAEVHPTAAAGTRGLLFVDVIRAMSDLLADVWTLCVIEDVQWADRDTSDMLVTLSDTLFAAPRPLPLLMVVTERTRAGEINDTAANLERRTHASTLYVRPLDELEVDELIRVSGIEHPSRSLVRTLFELSAGNPLYVCESLRRIEQLDGFVERSGGIDTRVSIAELGPPEDLAKLVQRRLDALAPATIELLTVASLMHGRIERGVLADVLDQSVDEAMDAALSNGFLIETIDGLEFAHPLTRRVLSERPAREERRALHARIAAALRARPASEHATAAAEIAHHLVESGLADPDNDTLAFLWLAGRHAYEVGSWADAVRFFEAGSRVSEVLHADVLLRAWMAFSCGRAHDQNYDQVAAMERYAEAKRLAIEIDDEELLGRAVLADLRLRELVRSTDSVPAPTDTAELDEVLARIGEAHPRLRSRLLLQYCIIEMGRARPDEGFVHGQEAARLARLTNDPITIASAESTLGMASLSIGDATAGEHRLRDALASLPKHHRPDLEGITIARLALTQLMLGNLDQAERSVTTAREIYAGIADHKGVCLSESIHATVAMLRGDFAAVEVHARAAEPHLRLSRDWFAPMLLYPALAEARSAQGDDPGAEAAIDLWKSTGQGGRGPARLLVAARARRLDRVQSLMADGRSHLALATWSSLFSVGLIGAVEEAASAVGWSELTTPLLAALDRMGEKNVVFSPGWGASAHRVRADLLTTSGETEQASAAYRAAIARMEQAGALPELARCHLGLGRLLVSAGSREGDEGYEHLAAAVALSESLGMPTVADGADIALAGLRRARPASQHTSDERDVKVLMFTDIVGSTRVSVEAGDDIYMELVDDHDAIVRRRLLAHRGTEVNSTGDGILASFATPSAALACAIEIAADVRERNESTGRTPLQLRIGLAMGRPIDRDGNLFGAAVNLAARLCAAARPGQALVDASISKAVGRRMQFDALDPLVLKGFAEPVSAYALSLA